jgi:hypothetical protein
MMLLTVLAVWIAGSLAIVVPVGRLLARRREELERAEAQRKAVLKEAKAWTN